MKTHNEIISDYTLNLEQVIYGGYTRKVVLEKLVYETYGNSSIADATELNIFIDITSILHPLYSERNRIQYNNITDISAGILNMCGHYRSFFWENLRVKTAIYLVNSLNTHPLNTKFVASYNSDFARKSQVTNLKSVIDNNLKLLEILCPYLSGIYFVNSIENYETSVIIANLIETINDGRPNLIISHDIYPMQLTALYKNTSYLYPSKYKTEDTSWMLPINEKGDYKYQFWYNYKKLKSAPTCSNIESISPINMPLLLAIAGYKGRYMSRVLPTPAARDFILSLVGSEDIKVAPAMFTENTDLASKYPVNIIEYNYNALDLTYALAFYRESPEAKAIQFLDLEDAPTVNKIVAKYYANNPIDLTKL